MFAMSAHEVLANRFILGPLVIHGPSSANYDVDLGPWLLSDWFHADFFSLYQVGLVSGLSAIPETSVLNGKGIFDCERGNYTACTGQAEYFEVTFVEGTKYKIGIVNTGTLLTYTFWIAGHNFTVVETDFVPIEPFTTAALNVGIGIFDRHSNTKKSVTDVCKANDTRSSLKQMLILNMAPTSGYLHSIVPSRI